MPEDRDLAEMVRVAQPREHDALVADWEGSRTKRDILEQIESHPPNTGHETPAPRAWRRLVPAAAVAAVAVGVVVVVIAGGRTPAIAGWTPAASGSTDQAQAAFLDGCAFGHQHHADDMRAGDLGLSDEALEFIEAPGEPAVVDLRGNAGTAVWTTVTDGTRISMDCTRIDSDWDGIYDHGGGSVGLGPVEPGVHIGRGVSRSQGSTVERIYGQVAENVADVVVVRADGVEVEATLGDHGHFATWWPGEHEVQEVILYDDDGVVMDRITRDDPELAELY